MWSNISSSIPSISSSPRSRLLNSIDGHENIAGSCPTSPKRGSGSPLMRYKHAVCSASSGYIYIFGGRFGNLPLDDDVWRFDPHQNTWLQLETIGCKPPSLQEHSLVEYNEQLYLFGGQVSTSSMGNSFWRLDLLTNEWHSMDVKSSKFGAYLGPTNRRGHSAVIYEDSMYIFGGFEDFRGSSAQLWQFNFITQRWELRNLSSTSARHPEPRYSHSTIVHRDSMYVYGGLSNLKPLNDLWRWCWRERRWFKVRTRGKAPGYLHGHTAIQAFDSMFVFGGERRGQPTRSLWRLNLNNLVWQKIRAKGPLPNPTTWHGAIANPLSILDEANYIIEGDPELLKITAATITETPVSDNCFASSNYDNSNGYQRNQEGQDHNESLGQGQTPQLSRELEPVSLSHSKSSSADVGHVGTTNSKNSTRTEHSKLRSLRLSFMRRRRANAKSCDARRPATIRPSASCSNNLISAIKLEKQQDQPPGENVNILDNLDTDIKQMFQQALAQDEPTEQQQQQPMLVDEISINQDELGSNLSSESQYHTARGHTRTESSNLNSDFNPSSQRTSCAYATPVSGLSTTTLRNDQSLGDLHGRSLQQAQGWLADVASPSHKHCPFVTKDRPKSELVQSLIDRADARIKHLYTPFFQNNQSLGTDSILRSRPSSSGRFSSGNTRREPASSVRNRRNTGTLDKSKRHTIHQTMTYYNLYFAEDTKISPAGDGRDTKLDNTRERDASTAGSRDRLAEQSELTSMTNRDDTSQASSSTIRDGFGSASGTLIGVRGGTGTSDSTDQESLATQSSESNTMRGDNHELNGRHSPIEYPPATTSVASDPDGNNQFRGRVDDMLPQKQQYADNVDSSGDNTSLSFSVIAEFEEDDMLQFSSPTDPILHQHQQPLSQQVLSTMVTGNQVSQIDCRHDIQSEQVYHRQTSGCQQPSQRSDSGESTSVKNRQQQLVAAHKSASSGYDSISGSYEQNQHSNTGTDQSESGGQKVMIKTGDDRTHDISSLGGGSSSDFLAESSPANSASRRDSNRDSVLSRDANWGRTVEQLKAMQHNGPMASTKRIVDTDVETSCNFVNNLDSSNHQPRSKSIPSKQVQQQDKKLESQHRLAATETPTQMQAGARQQPCPISQTNHKSANWPLVSKSRFFSRRKSKNRYWQLCMFVIGGKQGGSSVGNEPITIWRLYI